METMYISYQEILIGSTTSNVWDITKQRTTHHQIYFFLSFTHNIKFPKILLLLLFFKIIYMYYSMIYNPYSFKFEYQIPSSGWKKVLPKF